MTELLHRRYGDAAWILSMDIPSAEKMLPVIYRKDFEEKAFSAWCAYGLGMTFGDYLAALDARNTPAKSRAEIYAEMDSLFEGR